MKNKTNFQVGEVLEAKVINALYEDHIVVNIEGSFFQVEVQMPLKLAVGDTIKLVVDSSKPLRLKLHKQSKNGQTSFHI